MYIGSNIWLKDVKKNAKLEQKVNILTFGYNAKASKLEVGIVEIYESLIKATRDKG